MQNTISLIVKTPAELSSLILAVFAVCMIAIGLIKGRESSSKSCACCQPCDCER